jgi:hypothetical protein
MMAGSTLVRLGFSRDLENFNAADRASSTSRAYGCILFGKLSGLVCIVDRWLAKGWPNVVLYLFRNCIGVISKASLNFLAK